MKQTPPLLLLAEGRRARPRKQKVSRPREIFLHRDVANLLRRHCRSDWKWGHYPSGEHRDIRTAAKLKMMGTQPGWPDILLFDPRGRLHCLELKRIGGRLSEAQEAFREWTLRTGVPHATCETMEQVLVAFEAWGCLGFSAQVAQKTQFAQVVQIEHGGAA